MQSKFTGLWRHPDFVKLWAGETISLFGSQITAFAFPIIAALILNASPAQMGILGAVQFAPFLMFSLFAGVWVDRLRRRPIMIFSDIGRGVLLLSVPIAFAFQLLTIEYLYVVSFLVGTLTVFFDVSYQSYLPALVKREELVEGNSKLEVSRSLSQILGPGLAGILVTLITAPLTIILDAISFLVSGLFLGAIRTQETVDLQHQNQQGMLKSIREGLHVVLTNPILRSIASCTSTLNLFFNIVQAVFTLYILEELAIDPALFGIMISIGSIGALLGALLGGRVAKRFGLGRTIVGSGMMVGIAALFAPLASGPQWLIIVIITIGQFVGNFANPIYNINQVSLRQSIVPYELQGRMNASMRFLVWGTLPIGSLIGGALGEIIGLRATMLVGAIGATLAFLWVLLSPVVALREAPPMMEASMPESAD
jgi:MFS family permease